MHFECSKLNVHWIERTKQFSSISSIRYESPTKCDCRDLQPEIQIFRCEVQLLWNLSSASSSQSNVNVMSNVNDI